MASWKIPELKEHWKGNIIYIKYCEFINVHILYKLRIFQLAMFDSKRVRSICVRRFRWSWCRCRDPKPSPPSSPPKTAYTNSCTTSSRGPTPSLSMMYIRFKAAWAWLHNCSERSLPHFVPFLPDFLGIATPERFRNMEENWVCIIYIYNNVYCILYIYKTQLDHTAENDGVLWETHVWDPISVNQHQPPVATTGYHRCWMAKW